MAFQKGGYGTYRTKPGWEHYHGGLGFREGSQGLPPTKWQSPRRATMDYNKSGVSGTRIIDMVQRNGVHSMESNTRHMMRKIGRAMGRRFPLVWAAERAFDAFYTDPASDLASPAHTFNPNWSSAECNGVESVCEQGAAPEWFTNERTFCWNPNSPRTDNLVVPQIPGYTVYGYKWFWRCDLRGTQYEWYGAAPTVKRTIGNDGYWLDPAIRDWPYTYGQPGRIPLVDPNLLPEAQPIQSPAVQSQRRPYWARPARLRGTSNGREAGYTMPGQNRPPPVTVPPLPPHVLQPPARGEKEQKVRGPKWLIRAVATMLYATEIKDAAQAIADGLGWDKKRKPGEGLIPFIYRRWADATTAELQQAILNVLINEVEDQVVGRLSRPLVVEGVGTFRQVGDTWILQPWRN